MQTCSCTGCMVEAVTTSERFLAIGWQSAPVQEGTARRGGVSALRSAPAACCSRAQCSVLLCASSPESRGLWHGGEPNARGLGAVGTVHLDGRAGSAM